jgi:hypothetical protein
MENELRKWMRLVESEQTLYHVTPIQNLKKIMRDGLIPKRGVRSRAINEPTPAIYLFPSMADVESAMDGWMGNSFSDEARLALLAVILPPNIHPQINVEYERVVHDIIPPENIRVLSRDILGEIGFDHLK